jgi:hypothetical protein
MVTGPSHLFTLKFISLEKKINLQPHKLIPQFLQQFVEMTGCDW